MASEKRIFTLTLIVLLVVFLSFNTVLPCWVLGQCANEGFREGATALQELYQVPGMTKAQVDDLMKKLKEDTSCSKKGGRGLDIEKCKTLKTHEIGQTAKNSDKLPPAYAKMMESSPSKR